MATSRETPAAWPTLPRSATRAAARSSAPAEPDDRFPLHGGARLNWAPDRSEGVPMRKAVMVAIVALLLAGGFLWWRSGGPDGMSGGANAVIQANDPLRFVPEDSPYVFANLAPLPEAVVKFSLAQIDPQIPHWRRQIAMVLEAWDAAQTPPPPEPVDGGEPDIETETDPHAEAIRAL